MMHRRNRSCDAVLGDRDLLTEILLRLPVKDVLRSKCVCNKWRTLISEPQFCHRHTLGLCRKHKHNPDPNPYPSGILRQTSGCLFCKTAQINPFTSNSNNRFIHLDIPNKLDESRCYSIQQSCNGLLLWDSSPDLWSSSPYQGCNFYVTNPSTGQCVRIDYFGYECRPKFSKPYFVFEPWKSPYYKIIFFKKEVRDSTTMSVYSSETGSWSKVDIHLLFPDYFSYFGRGVYSNGVIHWYSLGNLVYFDIDRLCLKNLPTLPLSPLSELNLVYFGECGGHLHLILKKYNEKLRYDIWELKKDYSGWILRYYIDLTTLQAHSFDIEVLCVVRQSPKENEEDEEEESMLAILAVDNKNLIAYNLKDHSSRIIYQEVDVFYRTSSHHQYFETLASI